MENKNLMTHKESLETLGEINYQLLSKSLQKECKDEKERFLKYKDTSKTSEKKDNLILGKIAKKIVTEIGFLEKWPDPEEFPFLCFVMEMKETHQGWEWKLKPKFCKFILSL